MLLEVEAFRISLTLQLYNASPLKVITLLVVLLTVFIAYYCLEDWTVVDLDDLDTERPNILTTATTRAKPMIDLETLERILPAKQKQSTECEDATTRRAMPEYRVFKTIHNKANKHKSSPIGNVMQLIQQLISILRTRNAWKVIVFSFASVAVCLQWTASDVVLPPFLERRFGEGLPIYTIQSIHMLGCLVLPPIVGALTNGNGDFQIVMPGLWIMAVSPLFLALSPNVAGACAWQVFMVFGQVLWSPRQDSWIAGLAPTGMEGLFFAVGSSRALLAPLGDWMMGMMNDKYNTNCKECRDEFGHFCDSLVADGSGGIKQCASIQRTCKLFLDVGSCPTTCIECPTWKETNPSTFWYLLMLMSVVSPMMVWVFLPFLRDKNARSDRCYGVFIMNRRRLMGIYGATED